jgi:hypothetical protein
VPLVQLPLRLQKLLPPFCQVVEGALKLPHWARACCKRQIFSLCTPPRPSHFGLRSDYLYAECYLLTNS